jgi:hypothetical protein
LCFLSASAPTKLTDVQQSILAREGLQGLVRIKEELVRGLYQRISIWGPNFSRAYEGVYYHCKDDELICTDEMINSTTDGLFVFVQSLYPNSKITYDKEMYEAKTLSTFEINVELVKPTKLKSERWKEKIEAAPFTASIVKLIRRS